MAWYLFGVPLLCLNGHFGFGKDVSFKGAALGLTATPDVYNSRISRPPPLNPGGQGPPPPPPPTSRSLYRHNSANSMQVTTVAPAGGGGGGGGGGQQHLTVSQMQHRSGDKLNPQTLASCEKSSTMSSITAHNSPI